MFLKKIISYSTFILCLVLLVFSISESQGFPNYYAIEMETEADSYAPSFSVHIENTFETILRTADWTAISSVQILCWADVDSRSSTATLEAYFYSDLIINIDLGVPDMEELHTNTPALGEYIALKVLNPASSHVANETGIRDGFYVNYTGSIECEATIDGKASGGGPIIWDAMESVELTITHDSGVTTGDIFRILLHDFVYVVDMSIYYKYLSGTTTDVYIDATDVRTYYTITPTTITTVTYAPGFGLIITSVVLVLLSLSFIIQNYMKKRKKRRQT